MHTVSFALLLVLAIPMAKAKEFSFYPDAVSAEQARCAAIGLGLAIHAPTLQLLTAATTPRYDCAVGVTYRFPITSGDKVSAIEVSSGDTVYAHPVRCATFLNQRQR